LDAIECGIVRLPRASLAEIFPIDDVPIEGNDAGVQDRLAERAEGRRL
jgi:hypothetical protein